MTRRLVVTGSGFTIRFSKSHGGLGAIVYDGQEISPMAAQCSTARIEPPPRVHRQRDTRLVGGEPQAGFYQAGLARCAPYLKRFGCSTHTEKQRASRAPGMPRQQGRGFAHSACIPSTRTGPFICTNHLEPLGELPCSASWPQDDAGGRARAACLVRLRPARKLPRPQDRRGCRPLRHRDGPGTCRIRSPRNAATRKTCAGLRSPATRGTGVLLVWMPAGVQHAAVHAGRSQLRGAAYG